MSNASDIPTGWKAGAQVNTEFEESVESSVPEDSFEPIILGVPSGGLVSTFGPSGAALWSISEDERLRSLVGRGALPRMMFDGQGMRETALLDVTRQRLIVGEQISPEARGGDLAYSDNPLVSEPVLYDPPEDTPEVEIYVREHEFLLSEPTAPEANPWEEVESLMQSIALAAPERGEYVVLERAQEDRGAEDDSSALPRQYCLFGMFPDENGQPVVMLEASPYPAGAQFWQDVEAPEDGEATIALQGEDAVAASGTVATLAAASWEGSPWELLVTFIPLSEDNIVPAGINPESDASGDEVGSNRIENE